MGENRADQGVRAQAALAGYTTAFWWATGLFVAGAVVTAILYRPRRTHTREVHQDHTVQV